MPYFLFLVLPMKPIFLYLNVVTKYYGLKSDGETFHSTLNVVSLPNYANSWWVGKFHLQSYTLYKETWKPTFSKLGCSQHLNGKNSFSLDYYFLFI